MNEVVYKRRFRPQLIPSIAVLISVPVFFILANWQHQKGKIEEAKQLNLQANAHKINYKLPEINSEKLLLSEHLYKNFSLQGSFIGKDFLLDNQINDERAGFHLFSLFETDTGKLLLVNRGWLAQGKTRQQLPSYKTKKNKTTINGFIFPIRNIILDKKYKPKIDDELWQIIDTNLLNNIFQSRIYPFQLRLSANSINSNDSTLPIAFQNNTKESTRKVFMHKGYAGQFTLFGLTAIGLWGFYSWRKAI